MWITLDLILIKCQFWVLTTTKSTQELLHTINGDRLETKESVEDLDIIVSHNMYFYIHITNIVNDAYKRLMHVICDQAFLHKAENGVLDNTALLEQLNIFSILKVTKGHFYILKFVCDITDVLESTVLFLFHNKSPAFIVSLFVISQYIK